MVYVFDLCYTDGLKEDPTLTVPTVTMVMEYPGGTSIDSDEGWKVFQEFCRAGKNHPRHNFFFEQFDTIEQANAAFSREDREIGN